VAAALFAGPAWGWIEMTPKGLVSTVEVEGDGRGTVTHELTLDVRGGPLRELGLAIADADAEPLGDATVKKLPSGLPLPLVVERHADGSLGLEVDHERGLRSGRYLFSVRYRTDLGARNVLSRRGEAFELNWVGPRLDGGVDGARTVVRFPLGAAPPRLPEATAEDAERGFGVLVGAVRRTPSGDEIELLRSHVASGEPALWRVEVNPSAFPALSKPKTSAQAPAPVPRAVPVVRSPRFIASSTLLALVVGLVVWWKAIGYGRACASHGAKPRTLVPLPLWSRVPAAGLCAGAALFTGAELEVPSLAGVLLVLALALSAHTAPHHGVRPRGPGRWLPLSQGDAFTRKRAVLPGAWLDSGSVRGLALFALLAMAVLAVAFFELSKSPYRALLVVLTASVALPIFFSGRASDLVADRVAFSRAFLSRLSRGLRGRPALRAVPWARVPEGSAEPDELRVLVKVRDGIDGFVGLEVALEPQRGLFGVGAAPFVLVRVREGSLAERALPGAAFSRGRKNEERVAVLTPPLPTLGLTLSLVERIATRLTAQPPKSARMSSGIGASTRKLGTVASPAHAM